jgi:hypothetical protein
MSGRITIEGLQLPAPDRREKRALRLDGRIEVAGRPSRPQADGELVVSFPEWPLLDGHRLRVTAAYDSGAATAAAVGTDDRDTERLRMQARVPLVLSLWPVSFQRPATEPLRAELHVDDARLERIGPLLPGELDVGGQLDVDFVAEGLAEELRLDGRILAERLELTGPDGSRVLADAEIAIGGTSARPAVDGTIEVVQGVIQIPEAERKLHPVEGTSMLWESDWEPAADSLAAPAPGDSTSIPDADLSVRVHVPGQLLIRGRNMTFELAGDLARWSSVVRRRPSAESCAPCADA